MSKPKLPKQLYVTSREPSGDDKPLGFLHAYEPGKPAFEKKKATQDQWAYFQYSYLVNPRLEVYPNETWLVGEKRDYTQIGLTGTAWILVPVRELLKNPPVIWDNEPLTGFKVEKSVSRYSTSNKLWRILDPRGIEFEISTDCMEQIIQDATILKGGIIDAKCAWMSNKNLVIVP